MTGVGSTETKERIGKTRSDESGLIGAGSAVTPRLPTEDDLERNGCDDEVVDTWMGSSRSFEGGVL